MGMLHFGIKADLTGCPVVPTGSSGSLRGVDCNIPHRRSEDLVADLISSTSCWLVKRVLGPYMVTKNKSVRTVRPKADNIWQVGSAYDIWYRRTMIFDPRIFLMRKLHGLKILFFWARTHTYPALHIIGSPSKSVAQPLDVVHAPSKSLNTPRYHL